MRCSKPFLKLPQYESYDYADDYGNYPMLNLPIEYDCASKLSCMSLLAMQSIAHSL